MAKKCMSCGGAMKKMAKGGSNVKTGIYGIPQENIGTSSQFQPTAKKGGAVKKMAKGGFPDLNKDGKITKADVLKGRGVIKKTGGSVKKYQNGGPTVQDKSLFPGSEIVGFLGAGLGTALAARRQNSPKVQQKQKERIKAREAKKEANKKMQNGGSMFAPAPKRKMTVNTNPIKKSKYTTPPRKTPMAQYGGISNPTPMLKKPSSRPKNIPNPKTEYHYGPLSPKRDAITKPKTSNVNIRQEIQQRYGTGKNGELTPEDMTKLKTRGILKKGGTIKRKK